MFIKIGVIRFVEMSKDPGAGFPDFCGDYLSDIPSEDLMTLFAWGDGHMYAVS